MRTGFSSTGCSRLTQGFIRSWNKPDGSKLRLYLNGRTFQIEEISQGGTSTVLEKEGPWRRIRGIPDALHLRSLTTIRKYFQHTYVKTTHTDGKRILSIFQKGFGGVQTPENFIHAGINYNIKATLGYGSCALHALLGKECNGEYRFPGEEATSSSRAKTHFTDSLKNALDQANLTIHTIFFEMIFDYLNNPNTNPSAQLLFKNEIGLELQNQWAQLKEEEAVEKQAIYLKEAEIWKTAFNNNPDLKQLILRSARAKTIYSGKENAEIETLMLAEPLRFLDIVNEDRDPPLALIEQNPKNDVAVCRDELQHHLEAIDNRKRAFCGQLLSHYIDTVKIPDYYLNTNEIKLAAHLFQKNVFIFTEDFTFAETIEVLNANELIVIWHQGVHFSRCVATADLALDMAKLNLNAKNSTEAQNSTFTKQFHEMEVELEDIILEADEDALPSGAFAPTLFINSKESRAHLNTLMNPPDPEAFEEAFQHLLELMPEEQSQRIRHRFCQRFADTPAALIEMLNKSGLPILQDLELRIPALKNMISAAESELEKTQNELVRQTSGLEELSSQSEILTETINGLKQHLVQAEEVQQRVKKEWQVALITMFKNISNRNLVWKSFTKARELNPWSIDSFSPFLTLLADVYKGKLITSILQDAYTCDPHRTYAIALYYIRMAYTSGKNIKNSVLLNFLLKSFPNDLFVTGISQDSSFDTIRAGVYLSLSLQQLSLNRTKTAILTLVKAKQQFVGFSIFHQYLALAWILDGETEKAAALLKRASYQMDIRGNASNLIINAIVKMFSYIDPEIAKALPLRDAPLSPTLPQALITFLQHNFCAQTATTFIKECKKALMNDVQQLPWVYFGIRWLIAQAALSNGDFEVCRKLWIEIGSLLSICARIHHLTTNGKPDPWIAKRLTLNEDISNGKFDYIVEFSKITFGRKTEEEFPKFQFNGFELCRESLCSIATILTKQLYSFSIGLLTAHLVPKKFFSHKDEIGQLPDDPALFSAILFQGLQPGIFDSAEFQSAYQMLNKYTALATKPFIISADILEWARLCTRWANPDERQEPLLAVNRINARSTAALEVNLPTDGEGIYRVFETSQLLFGWRTGESFAEWGIRLEEMASCGPFAAEHKMTHETSNNELHSTIIVPIHGKMAHAVLREIFKFWIEFHRITVAKNKHIAEGGDEEGGSNNRPVEFHEKLPEGLWTTIVKDNTPKKHPRYKGNEKSLTDIVKKKHGHALEIRELKKLSLQKKKEKMSAEDLDIHTISHILKQVEKSRKEASPNVWVRDEEEAIQLYRILLEITIDRLVAAELMKLGPDSWSVKDSRAAAALIIRALTSCRGKFHGPETHPSGDAPLHWHYNAHVYTSKDHLGNVHLFYGDL